MEAITSGLSPVPEPCSDRAQSRDSVITLRVGHPLTLVEAIDVQRKVRALIARHPAAIVLDVAGLMPTDEMGVLMLPAMAHDAAEEGVTVVLANPSRPLRDRLAQLGVRNLTFVYRPAPTAPTEDGVTSRRQPTHSTCFLRPVPRSTAGADGGPLPSAQTGGSHHETVPGAPRPHGARPHGAT